MPDLTISEVLLLCLGTIGCGFVLLSRGGDWLIDASVYIAGKAGVSRLLIGATIVAFGTSAPELAVSLDAAFMGFDDLAVGNAVGSNISNILLILGMQVLLAGAVSISPWAVRRDVMVLLLASFTLTAFAALGELPRLAGVTMVLALAGFVYWQTRRHGQQGATSLETHIHSHAEEVEETSVMFRSTLHAVAFIMLGLVTLVLGAKILVLGAVVGARTFGVSEAVIGLTIVAVGTSLPELFAGLVAVRKGHGDIAIGNILGSNLFNILAILGMTAALTPLTLSAEMMTSLIVMCATSLLFCVLLWRSGRMTRPVALLFVAAYCAYTAWLYYETLAG